MEKEKSLQSCVQVRLREIPVANSMTDCRALVAEAMEISSFMSRLAEDDRNMELEMKEWARFV